MQLRSRFYNSSQQQGLAVQSPALSDGPSSLKPMIMRLETSLGCQDLTQSMVLLSKPQRPRHRPHSENHTVNFVVGYNGSAHSQAALDLALWMAHQTRLARPNSVIVHVVYVIDKTCAQTIADADRILWQARSLASEWQGPLDVHLRIGQVATSLSDVASDVQADVLLLGCHTGKHTIVQQLAPHISCSVLGLPR